MPNRFERPEDGATSSASASTVPVGAAPASRNGRPMRASWSAWRCASLASLALAGCVVANVAGCGGGGGGGTVVPTPQLATATILLLNPAGTGVNGTVTLNDVTKTTTNSRAVFPNLRAGTYPLTFTVAGVSTRTSIVVAGNRSETYVAVPGLSNVSSNGIQVRGRTLLNSPATSTDSACTSDSQPVTAPLVIQVRALNLVGRPIVATGVRAANTDGRYIVFTIPSPGTYRVEARSLDSSAAPFSGSSASFTIQAGQTQQNLDICTNQSLSAPGGTPPPPPGTATPVPGTGTGTGTPNATLTAGATPGATATTNPNATATATGGVGVPTQTAAGTPTNSPVPQPTATPGPGTPTAAPTATTAPIGGAATAVPPGAPAP